MGSCSSTSTIARSIDPDVCKTNTRGESLDSKEPEHITKLRRKQIEIIYKGTMTDVSPKAISRSTLTSSEFSDKSDKISSSSSARTEVSSDSGSFSRDFSKSTIWSTSDLCFDVPNKGTTNRYEIGLEMLKAMINEGADPKTLVTHGERTCLMFTVLAEDFDFVKKLVKLGVNVNKTNSRGESALGFANELKRYDIANYLREHGAFEEQNLQLKTRGIIIN